MRFSRVFTSMIAFMAVVMLGDFFLSPVFPQTKKVVVVPLAGCSLATRWSSSGVSGLSFFGNNALKNLNEGTICAAGGANDYFAEVHLPQGAVIKQVSVHYHCTDFIGLIVSLRRYNPFTRSYEEITSITCPYNLISQSNQSPITTKNAVDNQDYTYFVVTTLGTTNYLHSVHIDYTTEEVVP